MATKGEGRGRKTDNKVLPEKRRKKKPNMSPPQEGDEKKIRVERDNDESPEQKTRNLENWVVTQEESAATGEWMKWDKEEKEEGRGEWVRETFCSPIHT